MRHEAGDVRLLAHQSQDARKDLGVTVQEDLLAVAGIGGPRIQVDHASQVRAAADRVRGRRELCAAHVDHDALDRRWRRAGALHQ